MKRRPHYRGAFHPWSTENMFQCQMAAEGMAEDDDGNIRRVEEVRDENRRRDQRRNFAIANNRVSGPQPAQETP